MNKYKIIIKAPPQYILNLFKRHCVNAQLVKCECRSVQCSLNRQDYLKVIAALKKAKISYEEIGITGVKQTMQQAVKMYGAIAGILVVVVGMIIYNSGLFSINISGNSGISDEIIVEEIYLQCGNILGAFSKIDEDNIASIVLGIEGVSYVSVERTGTVLSINIVEEATKVEINDTQNYNNILSEYDGIITSLTVVSGTGMVGVGSVVCAGDILIAAYTLDIEGNEVPVSAEGTATGRVAFSKQITYTESSMVEIRTGQETTLTSINILGLKTTTTSPYELYETTEKTDIYSALLSYEITTTTYYELTTTLEETNFEENQEAIIKAEQEAFFATLNGDFIYIRDWYLVKVLDKMTILSIYYEVETTMA